MSLLQSRSVFLSASLPTWDRRAEAGGAYSPQEISDAVTAIARLVLQEGGRIVFGGHPTISPMLFWIARELNLPGQITVYQSEFFRELIPEDTLALASEGYAEVVWTRARSTREKSLDVMRRQMLLTPTLVGAVFVGGMRGIRDEFDLAAEVAPGALRLPLGGPGGAARLLVSDAALPASLAELEESRRYPYLANLIVETLSAQPRN